MQVAYNQAMASCSWEQAWACFHAMRRAGVQPNTRSYNAVSIPTQAPVPRSAVLLGIVMPSSMRKASLLPAICMSCILRASGTSCICDGHSLLVAAVGGL